MFRFKLLMSETYSQLLCAALLHIRNSLDRKIPKGAMVNNLRAEYFKDLGFGDLSLAKPDTVQSDFAKKALERAYQLRSFEIEHYWKRATYFWGYQIALFAALAFIAKPDLPQIWNIVALMLPMLGAITAWANVLSMQGSKFWQENWENHIDMLEDGIEGRLYKTVWVKEGKPGPSVSKVNLALGWCFVVFWTLTALVQCAGYVGHYWGVPYLEVITFLVVLILVGLTLCGAWYLGKRKTDFGDAINNLSGTPNDKYRYLKRPPPTSGEQSAR